MKKWLTIPGLMLVVSLVILTSCATSTQSYKTQEVIKYTGSSYNGTPPPEITLSIPASSSPVQVIPSPSDIAQNIFGSSSSSPQSYPVYTNESSSGVERGTTTPTTTPATSSFLYTSNDQRMIVRTGNVTMVVNDIPAAIAKITQLTNDNNGYVVSANKYSNNKIFSGVISLRVPADQFENIMNSLRVMAVKVTTETISATDVSQEYTDLSSKLKNLEAAEAQLIAIMAKAGTVTEVLEVQNQLTSTREEIEVTKGRMQYLEQTSAMSLITVNLQQSTLVLNLVAGTRNARTGDNINFGVSIQGGISPFSYKWDFGDGDISTDESPWHKYSSSGQYTVSVLVTDDSGTTATDTRTSYMTISPGWSAGDVAKGAGRGFLGFSKFLFAVLLWVLYFSPFILIGVGIWYLIRRARRNRKIKLATAQESEVKRK
jgi:chitodextrinase